VKKQAAAVRLGVLKVYEAYEQELNDSSSAAPFSKESREHFIKELAAAFKDATGAAWPELQAVLLAMEHSLKNPAALSAVVVGQCDIFSEWAHENSRGLLEHAGHFAQCSKEICSSINKRHAPQQPKLSAGGGSVQQQCSTAAVTWAGGDIQQYCPAHLQAALGQHDLATVKHTTVDRPLQGFRSAEWFSLHRAYALALLLGVRMLPTRALLLSWQ
jgi:hypothetical protein